MSLQNIRRIAKWSGFGFLAMAVAACGGGGSSDTPPDALATLTFQSRAAVNNNQTATKTYTVTGTGSDGIVYALTMAMAPTTNSSSYFPTATRASAVSLLFRKAGVTVNTINATNLSDATTLLPQGIEYPDGSCAVMTSSTAVADTAKVGDRVASADGTVYLNCASKTTPAGYISATTSIERDGDIPFICGTATSKSSSLVTLATVTTCVEIAQDGQIKDRARVSVVGSALTVTAKNY